MSSNDLSLTKALSNLQLAQKLEFDRMILKHQQQVKELMEGWSNEGGNSSLIILKKGVHEIM